jgi:flagellar basal body rod protein FlgB
MNPTNNKCPNNIAQQLTTDYRPRKKNYENVVDNNAYRLYLQQNAEKLMAENKSKFIGHMKCCACDKHVEKIKNEIPAYKCEQQGMPLDKNAEKKEEKKGLMAYFGY